MFHTSHPLALFLAILALTALCVLATQRGESEGGMFTDFVKDLIFPFILVAVCFWSGFFDGKALPNGEPLVLKEKQVNSIYEVIATHENLALVKSQDGTVHFFKLNQFPPLGFYKLVRKGEGAIQLERFPPPPASQPVERSTWIGSDHIRAPRNPAMNDGSPTDG